MNKAALLLLMATLMITSVFASTNDVEIIDMDEAHSTVQEPIIQKDIHKKQPEKWVWSDEVLRDKGIVRLTNEIYDQEILAGPWLLVFLKDRHNETDFFNVYFSKQLVQIQQARDQVANLTGLRVAFIDIAQDGELLKETFDIDSIPSVRLVHDGFVYQMQWNKE